MPYGRHWHVFPVDPIELDMAERGETTSSLTRLADSERSAGIAHLAPAAVAAFGSPFEQYVIGSPVWRGLSSQLMMGFAAFASCSRPFAESPNLQVVLDA